MKNKSVIVIILLTIILVVTVPQNFIGEAYARGGLYDVAIGVQEPYGVYQVNTSIPITLNLRLLFGTTEQQQYYNFTEQTVKCECRVDNGELIDVPFERVTSNVSQWDLNFPYINIVYCLYSINITGLPVGLHTLTAVSSPISAWVVTAEPPGVGLDDVLLHPSPVSFSIVGPPLQINVLSPENQTYKSNNLALNFTVNRSVSSATYSLDGSTNQTIDGNMTLPQISAGLHNVTVYVNCTDDTFGKSDTIDFTVTKQSEPFPTMQTVILVIAVFAVAVTSTLLYRRRKHG